MTVDDSIVERAERVEHSLRSIGDTTAQAAVGGPCPTCGAQVETVLRTGSTSVTCEGCGSEFPVTA